MASITLRPTSASGTSWSNTANVYDGNTSTSGTVSVASNNYADRFLTCNFDTSVIPSGATINSATLTVIAKQSSSYSSRRITPRVDINGDSNNRVINQQLTSTTSTTLTADVTSYISNLTSLTVTPYVRTSRSGTFTLYEVYIDVDYTEQTYTVTFKDWNGDVLDTQTVAEGGSATNPGYPNRDGYLCIGWDNNYSNVTSDIDVTAQYVQEQSVPSDNIMTTFDSADWTFLNFNAIERKANSLSGITSAAWGGFYLPYPDSWKGKNITIGFNETESGVAGVNIQSLGGETNYLNLYSGKTSDTVNIPIGTTDVYIVINRSEIGNIWITGLYAREVIEHTVTFKSWNETVLKTETVEEGNSATPPTLNPRDGYTFVGWCNPDDYKYVTKDLIVRSMYTANEFGKVQNIVFTQSRSIENEQIIDKNDPTFYTGLDLYRVLPGKSFTVDLPAAKYVGWAYAKQDGSIYTKDETNGWYETNTSDWSVEHLTVTQTAPEDAYYIIIVATGNADGNMSATITLPIYDIIASAGTGGTISPSGTTTVDEGTSQTYTISANRGYKIKDVLIDGVSQGAITSYTFTNVTANHTIEVVFESVPIVVAAIEKNIFYAIKVFEGYDKFSIGKDGVYLNQIAEDLNEDENIYLDKDGILHVYQFIEDINYGIFNPETELKDFEYESDGSGSYTLTGWKGTLNGIPSTELVIPDNKNIIL